MPAHEPFVRTVDLEIDRESWTLQPAEFRHSFPRVLSRQPRQFPIHLLLMFLRLGELTTPVLGETSGIARIWPLLRYLHAIAPTPGLRLVRQWSDVERHLKAIASDDFGVGLGMSVLSEIFGYDRWIDGRDYLEGLAAANVLAPVHGHPPKVGVMKMADFAARDRSGKFHLIECKGTGTSRTALASAIASGAEQKRSLICATRGQERRLIGQRLVTGVLLRYQNSLTDTLVQIVDPAPRDRDFVLRNRVPTSEVVESFVHAEFVSALRSAGAVATAEQLKASPPARDYPKLIPAPSRTIEAAASDDREALLTFEEAGQLWIGQRATVPLWSPLEFDGDEYRYAHLTSAVSPNLLESVARGEAGVEWIEGAAPREETKRLAQDFGRAEGPFARLERPGFSMSSVELTRQPRRELSR